MISTERWMNGWMDCGANELLRRDDGLYGILEDSFKDYYLNYWVNEFCLLDFLYEFREEFITVP